MKGGILGSDRGRRGGALGKCMQTGKIQNKGDGREGANEDEHLRRSWVLTGGRSGVSQERPRRIGFNFQ